MMENLLSHLETTRFLYLNKLQSVRLLRLKLLSYLVLLFNIKGNQWKQFFIAESDIGKPKVKKN